MSALEGLGPRQLDVLREVANIGAGHAATALSELTRCPVMISVPRVSMLGLDAAAAELAPAGETVTGVLLAIAGDVAGRTLLLVDCPSARALCRILVPGREGQDEDFTELERSALRELGNILTSAYAGALGEFLGLMLLPSVPELRVDRAGELLREAARAVGRPAGVALCVDTRFAFRDSESPISATFVLVPEADALRTIFRAIRLPA